MTMADDKVTALDAAQIAEAEALAKTATPGPWDWSPERWFSTAGYTGLHNADGQDVVVPQHKNAALGS